MSLRQAASGPVFGCAPRDTREQAYTLLDACLHSWDELVTEVACYTSGDTAGVMLWELHSNLKMVLSNLGVPTPVLNTPLPGGDLRSILGHVKRMQSS